MIDRYVTDYGNVCLGPVFKRSLEELVPSLKKRKNSKAYKAALHDFEEIERTIKGLARVYWKQGKHLTRTP